MNTIRTTMLTLLAATLLSATGALADVSLNSIRLGTSDSEATAEFYKEAFGMHEVNRIPTPAGPEIFLNFGATQAEANANAGPPIVLMNRGPNDVTGDPMAHLILTVSDAVASAAAVRKAGGTIPREPFPYLDTGIVIGFAVDPDGNQIEMIQPAQ
jgi:predicted enzyme related to lactoylglutathione lyase